MDERGGKWLAEGKGGAWSGRRVENGTRPRISDEYYIRPGPAQLATIKSV